MKNASKVFKSFARINWGCRSEILKMTYTKIMSSNIIYGAVVRVSRELACVVALLTFNENNQIAGIEVIQDPFFGCSFPGQWPKMSYRSPEKNQNWNLLNPGRIGIREGSGMYIYISPEPAGIYLGMSRKEPTNMLQKFGVMYYVTL